MGLRSGVAAAVAQVATIAQVGSLAWGLPHATGAAKGKKKKKKTFLKGYDKQKVNHSHLCLDKFSQSGQDETNVCPVSSALRLQHLHSLGLGLTHSQWARPG